MPPCVDVQSTGTASARIWLSPAAGAARRNKAGWHADPTEIAGFQGLSSGQIGRGGEGCDSVSGRWSQLLNCQSGGDAEQEGRDKPPVPVQPAAQAAPRRTAAGRTPAGFHGTDPAPERKACGGKRGGRKARWTDTGTGPAAGASFRHCGAERPEQRRGRRHRRRRGSRLERRRGNRGEEKFHAATLRICAERRQLRNVLCGQRQQRQRQQRTGIQAVPRISRP